MKHFYIENFGMYFFKSRTKISKWLEKLYGAVAAQSMCPGDETPNCPFITKYCKNISKKFPTFHCNSKNCCNIFIIYCKIFYRKITILTFGNIFENN